MKIASPECCSLSLEQPPRPPGAGTGEDGETEAGREARTGIETGAETGAIEIEAGDGAETRAGAGARAAAGAAAAQSTHDRLFFATKFAKNLR